jgi:phage terminase large subunit GpA-like protein
MILTNSLMNFYAPFYVRNQKILKLSNPTLPDYGIDAAFQETDQKYWLLKCGECGDYTCLEDTFPDCLKTVNGRVIRACQKCHAELNPSIGQWVAKNSRSHNCCFFNKWYG